MAAYQYIYVMRGLSKTFTGGREILKNIHLFEYYLIVQIYEQSDIDIDLSLIHI